MRGREASRDNQTRDTGQLGQFESAGLRGTSMPFGKDALTEQVVQSMLSEQLIHQDQPDLPKQSYSQSQADLSGQAVTQDPYGQSGQSKTVEQPEQSRDALTGQFTFTGFMGVLSDESFQNHRGIQFFVYINIVNFKAFNQNYGFERGDDYLRFVACELSSVFTEGIVCRVNSDHFVVCTYEDSLEDLTAKLTQLRSSIITYEHRLSMGIKAGIYINNEAGTDFVHMIDAAHIACDYLAQSHTKDIVVYDAEIARKVIFMRYIITGFYDALAAGYIMPYYQREVRGLTGRICGYEVLARWVDPTYGIISPSVFVPLLEDAKLIHKLDLYIIQAACANLHAIHSCGNYPQPISVNLSRLDFGLCDIFTEVDNIRKSYDLSSNLLNIEVTESAVAEGSEQLVGGLRRFKRAGYQIWMDDFGSGYSSFNNLRRYDFDLIKIDMGFLADIETNPRARVIVSSIVSMATELGIRTLAEGVETLGQYDFLRSIGCGRVQGFYFGRPLECVLDDEGLPTFLNDEVMFDIEHEERGQHEYYETIGNINVMGTSPLQPKEMRVYSNIAFAIIEIEGREARHLYVNNAYAQVLADVGIPSLEFADKRINISGILENETFRRCAAQCEKSGEIENAEIVINGNVCTMEIRHIARHEKRAAFAVVMQNLSEYGAQQQAGDIIAALRYMLTLYFRVDLYDEDGTVENIYLESAQQGRITDEETDAVKAVRMYSERYLEPEERERFRRFYDMSTILERVAASGEDHVTDLYHSAIPEDKRRLQMYTILPFMYKGHWKGLSACRYVDTI